MTDLLNEIKSRGYWRINFRPLIDKNIISDLSQAEELVKKHHVELRGWDYPHYPLRRDLQGNLEFHNNFCQGWSNWENMKEIWRFYESGQFIHYLALREDWERSTTATKPKKGKDLEVASTIYQFIEIFEFASRLAKTDIYERGMNINIQIFKTKERELFLLNGLLPGNFKCSTEETISCFEEKLNITDIVSSPDRYAAQAAKKTLSIFGFTRSEKYIEGHQNKLRKGL